MDYIDRLIEEVQEIENLFNLKPARPMPREVSVVNAPPTIHRLSSLENDILLISRVLSERIPHILRKEAFSLFIPQEADSVPQVHDLAWIYSGTPLEIWERIRVKPSHPFTNYDPNILLSLFRTRGRIAIMKNLLLLVRASSRRGHLTLPLYLAMINRLLSERVKLTDSDLRVMEALSANPYANTKWIKERTGVSEPSISRSFSKLRKMNCIFGPENVSLWNLGLTTVIASFPNAKRYREAFWNFPFTYTQLIPLSGRIEVYAYISFPYSGLNSLRVLRKVGVGYGVVKGTFQGINLRPPGDVMEVMARAQEAPPRTKGSFSLDIRKPPIRLSKDDLRILNQVLRDGRVSSTKLSKMGIRSAKQKLSKLRSSGLLRNYYMVNFPRGMSIILMGFDCSPEEMGGIAATLMKASSVLMNYIEGEEGGYCLAISILPHKLRSEFIVGVKAIFGDELQVIGEVFDVHPLWLLPIELWDRRASTFRWESPLRNLISRLS